MQHPRASCLASLVLAACGVEHAAPSPDAHGVAAPDASPPHGVVDFGTLDRCPTRAFVADSHVYWTTMTPQGTALSRSPIDAFAPEVVYVDPSVSSSLFRAQPVRGGFVWETGSWPVRLDLATREARPLLHKQVRGLAVVDGYRVFVMRNGDAGSTEIDEVGDGEALTPIVVRGSGISMGRLLGGPQTIYWLEQWNSQTYSDALNVLTGFSASGDLPKGELRATHADHAHLYTIVVSDSNEAKLVEPGQYPIATLPTGSAFAIAGGDGGPLYVTVDGLLYRYDQFDQPLTLITGGSHVSAIASDGDMVFLSTCDGAGGATLARLYPAS